MQELSIRICKLSKYYSLRSTNKDGLIEALTKPAAFWSTFTRPQRITALDNISTDLGSGQAIALIGPNGAGKSTLLSIIARISEPSAGSVDVYGSVGSLLEVGVGFHLELSGRENIFLGGAILGMSRQEVARQFDEIVEFSGIEQQLDMPIKFYSSGMFLRLGFAVAAFLSHDILLLDEILAVGDLEFQRKCMEKVRELTTQGRTAIIVSHNFSMTSQLCSTAIYLRKGTLQMQGQFQPVLARYIQDSLETAQPDSAKPDKPRISSTQVDCADNMSLTPGQPITCKVGLKGASKQASVNVAICILNARNHMIVSAITPDVIHLSADENSTLTIGLGECSVVPGVYSMRVLLLGPGIGGDPEQYDSVLLSPAFHVVGTDLKGLPAETEFEGVFKMLEVQG